MRNRLTRREFIKLAALGVGGIATSPLRKFPDISHPINSGPSQTIFEILDSFPQSEHLARVAQGKINIKARPDIDSENVGVLYDNAVVPWLREVVGRNPFRFVQKWVETPDGYIWAPYVQKVQNKPEANPMASMPEFSEQGGIWVEVTVPFVDLVIDNPPVRSPSFRNGIPQRLYFQQVVWVDSIRVDDNEQVWYRINERFGSYGDIFWAPGRAFRVIHPDELAPIHPEVEDKRILINVYEDIQTLSCFEGDHEVYFCRISAGQRASAEGKTLDRSATPLGTFPTWRKLYSIHMSGGTSGGGWDLMGVAWTCFFTVPGIAIHSTFWHNNFGGEYMSHGCVNALADDAKWIFRWTAPPVSYGDGDLTIQMPGGTKVEVIE